MINIDNVTIRHGNKLTRPHFHDRYFEVLNPAHYDRIPFDSTEGRIILHKTLVTDIIGGEK